MTVFDIFSALETVADVPQEAVGSAAGLSAECLTLYQFLSLRGGCTIDAAARAIGWSATTTLDALSELQGMGLVDVDADTAIRLDDPWNALRRLVREESRQLARSEAALSKVRQTRLKVLHALPQLTAVHADRLHVEIPHDSGLAITHLLGEASAGVQIMNMSRPGRPYLAEDLTDHVRRLTENGVGTAALILDSQQDCVGPAFSRSGARVCTATSLPFSMVVIDDRVAVCELDLDAGYPCALLTRSLPLVDLFSSIFRHGWATAETYRPERCASLSPDPDIGLDRREQLTLRMLADGMKDEAIARNIGISVRTLRRVINKIQDRLQTRNRLETVAVATRRGLLP
ncbi:LuxR C-terminal-related transcriptional regulator [Streptosporangium canum]